MPLTSLIPVGAWLWDKYGASVMERTAGAIRGRWERFRWKDAAESYRSKITKLYGNMQIMGMAHPVPLDDIFTDAYMLDKPTAFSRFDIEQLKLLSADRSAAPEAERTNGLRLVVEKGNLFILGKPGAGKTTFLKYVALKGAEQVIDKVPIFVSLKHWSDSALELLPFIVERFDICNFPEAQPFVEELLKSGNAIVLFDGLDEVNQESGQRDKQTRSINNFVEKYDRTQCLITCRIAASDYSFQPFTYIEIADFTQNQIEVFVGNWFRNDEGERDLETSKRFLSEFSIEKGLRELARTPLLLTLLCLAFNETLTFPQRRVEIYEEALDALLKKWDSSRRIKRDDVYRKLSLGHKENMLARIAAESFEKNQYFIPKSELERLITEYIRNVPPHDTNEATDGEAILKAIEAQHGIFVERARDVYSFSHLTFQEYFTAKYIAANATRATLENLVQAHCADERWREVFLLTASLLPDASQFMKIFRLGVDELLKGDFQLAALFEWADRKASLIQLEPVLARRSYLSLEVFLGQNTPHEILYARAYASGYASGAKQSHREQLFILDENLSDVLKNAKLLPQAINAARDSGLIEFSRELSSLSNPDTEDHDAQQLEFVEKLRDLTVRYRDIGHDWQLTTTQQVTFAEYFKATYLLESCLELAFMPPDEKKSILNSLYLPSLQNEDSKMPEADNDRSR